MNIKSVINDLVTLGSPVNDDSVTVDEMKKPYGRKKPISGYLPWLDVVNGNMVLLEDAKSVAAVYEIEPIPTEARSEAFILQQRQMINDFITNAFEEHNVAPWTVSIYSWNDKATFLDFPDQLLEHAIKQHASRDAEITPYTRYFVEELVRPHIQDMAADGGIFKDPLANDRPWGGVIRKTYIVFYRRQTSNMKRRKNMTAEKELGAQCKRVKQVLRGAGVKCKRLGGEEIRNWLFRWLNPAPKLADGDIQKWLKMNPYCQSEDQRPADWDFVNDTVSRDIRSDEETQAWYFDGKPHTLLSVERMVKVPEIGQVSAERYQSKTEISGPNAKTICMIDDLPESSVVIITYVVKPQSGIRKHLERLAKNAKGDTPEARNTRHEVEHARMEIAQGNKLYPFCMGIAIRANDDDHLDDVILKTDTVLATNGFQIIDPEYDLVRLDRYIRFLPFSYDVSLEQVSLRERIIYTHHLANILPVYGRSRGTGNPGLFGFNRGGEPFTCDPLSQEDRSKNGHLFLFGPTGAGKSATLVFLQMIMMAVYSNRWVTVEAGNSFELLTKFFRRWGFKVVDIVLRPGQAPSIPPYKPALGLVDDEGNLIQTHSRVEKVLQGEELPDEEEDDSIDHSAASRDILGEMLIIARLMVTGGEEKEEALMSRSDVGLLKSAIINAASTAKLAKKTDILTEDVIKALSDLKQEKPGRLERIDEMVEAMELFTDGFAGELFNRPGEELPDADYIRIEMGALAAGSTSTNDKLSVAYISLVNQIIARAQRTQKDGRPTIMLTDEAHVITTNKLLATYLVIISKLLGRRMGLWLWQATQNMKDYPDEAEKMLSMFEWWMCLFIDEGELKNIERFRSLTPDQRSMLLSTTKQPPKYTEGVMMSDNVQGLFRMVPPGLCLALGQSEKEEKRERYKIMKEHSLDDELDAAIIIGNRMAESRRKADKSGEDED